MIKFKKNLGVDKSTARRTAALFKTTGSVHKRPYPKEKAARKLRLSVYIVTETGAIS